MKSLREKERIIAFQLQAAAQREADWEAEKQKNMKLLTMLQLLW